MRKSLAGMCLFVTFTMPLMGYQKQDPLQKESAKFTKSTGSKLKLSFEERTRWEERYGVSFGKDANQQDMLSRLRIGMEYHPASWFTVSGMGQDSRAAFYGKPVPATLRDTMDLHESWIAITPPKSPFSFSAGRRMLNYGETRIIGVPQWGNVARTYDHGRFRYATKRIAWDALMVSPVVVQSDAFNTPKLGNRIWGTYLVASSLWEGASVDAYILRHSQNGIGGWKGAGTLGVNSFGSRIYGPLPKKFSYSLEAIGQTGHLGLQDQRAYAWYGSLSRTVPVGRLPLDLSVEYKQASGSRKGSDHSATFDQLSPANHDKFGHEDLFGWRNIRTFKTTETLRLNKATTLNLMYTDHHLFSSTDGLYNGSGSQISISSKGTAGTHVGQELDVFTVYKYGPHTFSAGFGHFFKGEFVTHTTPGINPRYFYLAQQYSF